MRASQCLFASLVCSCLGGCAADDEQLEQVVAPQLRSTTAWSALWLGCRQSMLHLQQDKRLLERRLPPGWHAASVLPELAGGAIASLGRVSFVVYDCLDEHAGTVRFGGMIGILIELPDDERAPGVEEYYAIAAFSSDTELLDRWNEPWPWSYRAYAFELDIDDGPYLIGAAGLSADDGTVMRWTGSGNNQASHTAPRRQRWWRELPVVTLSLEFSGQALSAHGIVHHCQFSDGSLAEYASGRTSCDEAESVLEQFPGWSEGLSVALRYRDRHMPRG